MIAGLNIAANAGAGRRCTPRRRALLMAGALLPAFLPLGPARADSVTVVAQQALRFGTLVVPANGTRTISANGEIADVGLLSIGGAPAGPAQFTVTYDRESRSDRPIDILMQVVLNGTQTVNQAGVKGVLSRFETDLPGSIGLISGSIATFTINNCRERRCSKTFRVGAQLQVERSQGGGDLAFALPVTASILAVD